MSSASSSIDASPALPSASMQRLEPMPDELPPLPESMLSRCDEEQEASILTALKQTHPGLSLLQSAVPCFSRLMNTLAHALLLGAELYDGRIALRSPAGISFGELVGHAVTEARTWAADLSRRIVSLSFAQRWLTEYRELHPESSLQLDLDGLGSLCGVVEYILAEVMELAGNVSREDKSLWVNCRHVLESVRTDDELVLLCTWLRAPFGATSASLTSAVHADDPVMALLTEQFAFNDASMRQLCQRCWFNDAAKVALYAQQYARGDLLAGDALLYRQHGVRLLRFYGRSSGLVFRHPGIPASGTNSVLSFELLDTRGRWHSYVCEFNRYRYPNSRVLSITGTVGNSLLGHVLTRSVENSPRTAFVFQKWPIVSVPWQRYVDHVASSRRAIVQSDAAVSASAAAASASLSAKSVVATAPSNAIITPGVNAPRSRVHHLIADLQQVNELEQHIRTRDRVIPAQCIGQLEQANDLFAVLANAICADTWSPQLFAEHHPLRVRAHFTAALLDHASQSVGLPVLPMDLLQLIGEYEPATLPFIEAEEQLVTSEERAARKHYATSTALEVQDMILDPQGGASKPVPQTVADVESEDEDDDDDE